MVWSYRTVLEQRIRERRQTLEKFAEYAENFAREHGEPGTLGVRHLQRLMSGRGPGGKPLGPVRPVTARLLERIFGEPIDTLLAEPVESAEAEALTSSAAAHGGSGPPVQNPRSPVKAARPSQPAPLRNDVDASDFGSALDWLDEHAGWSPVTAKHKVRSRLARLSAGELLDRNARRSRVRRSEVAGALADYYGQSSADCSLYNVACDGNDFLTSIVTRPEWIDFGCPVTPDCDLLTLDECEPSTGPDLDTKRAVHRLAEAAALDVRLTNAPLYRLQDVDLTNGSISGSVGLTPFVEYALTADLLEGELLDAISAGQSTRPGRLSLRNEYLPDFAAVLDLPGRICAGGPLALCAIARPADPYRGPADFALLVQERSGSVLNAAGQLAVIPKGFHQPLKEPRAEARIGATLRRELEEELFGRAEVDSTAGGAACCGADASNSVVRADAVALGRPGPGADGVHRVRVQPGERELRVREPGRHRGRGVLGALRRRDRSELGGFRAAALLHRGPRAAESACRRRAVEQ